tara:strand:- start:42 stop:341 length:300 start_codon:yes stop_codon:yes gene_type:complete
MALASRVSGDIHDKTGSDLTDLRSKYTNNKHVDLLQFEGEAALMYQIQLLREDIDELRRYIVSAELLLPDTIGDSIPTSDPRSSGQLWNNRGVLSVSRG